jgi:hypothetical protein
MTVFIPCKFSMEGLILRAARAIPASPFEVLRLPKVQCKRTVEFNAQGKIGRQAPLVSVIARTQACFSCRSCRNADADEKVREFK